MTQKVVPGLLNSQFRYRRILESLVEGGTDWLDVGCGHDIIPRWIPDSREWQQKVTARANVIVGVDADFSSLRAHVSIRNRVVSTLNPLPFKDLSFSLITMNMVAEHLQDPITVFRELFRVLRTNGIIIVHTPNRLSYRTLVASLIPQYAKLKLIKFFEDRDGHDVYPTFYRFNSESRIESVARQSGLKIVDLEFVETTPVGTALGSFVLPEVLFLRLLRTQTFRKWRSDLIALFRKEAAVGAGTNQGNQLLHKDKERPGDT